MERATGALGTAAIAAMDERLPWFRNLSAENRSWLGLVAQAGIAAFIDWIRHSERNRPALTEREREVVALIADGMSNAEIARQHTLSPLTVKTHANHAMTKLGARDRAQLVVLAYQTGLARPPMAR